MENTHVDTCLFGASILSDYSLFHSFFSFFLVIFFGEGGRREGVGIGCGAGERTFGNAAFGISSSFSRVV